MKLTIKQAILTFVVVLGSAFYASLSMAEISVIVNPANRSAITEKDIKQIYLGKRHSFPDGGAVSAVDQKEGAADRTTFNSKVLGKSDKQMSTYWAQMLFTGKATPPRDGGDSFAVKDLVGKEPSAIGYIDSSAVDDSVRVVFTF